MLRLTREPDTVTRLRQTAAWINTPAELQGMRRCLGAPKQREQQKRERIVLCTLRLYTPVSASIAASQGAALAKFHFMAVCGAEHMIWFAQKPPYDLVP